MPVRLHAITKERHDSFAVVVSFGDEAPVTYRASCNGDGATIDEPLFMRLSTEADEEFLDATLFHEELLRILLHLHDGGFPPRLPMEFGSSSFCPRRPGPIRLGWRRLRRALRRPTRQMQ